MVATLRELITRIDGPLARHLNDQGVEFIQFSFRWMNCLLMREFSIKNVIRMWDTYAVPSTAFLANGRRKDQRDFQSFMFMFVLRCWISIILRYYGWIFRFTPVLSEVDGRRLWCFCRRFLRRNGPRRRLSYSCQKLISTKTASRVHRHTSERKILNRINDLP